MIHYDPTEPKRRPSKLEIYHAWAVHMANAYQQKFIAEFKYQWRNYGEWLFFIYMFFYAWPSLKKLIKFMAIVFVIILFFAPIVGAYFK